MSEAGDGVLVFQEQKTPPRTALVCMSSLSFDWFPAYQDASKVSFPDSREILRDSREGIIYLGRRFDSQTGVEAPNVLSILDEIRAAKLPRREAIKENFCKVVAAFHVRLNSFYSRKAAL
ncbi:hypothetical protein AVEN_28711-1 [Araneus ventricosus]|uniref:Uncharacterized protein n=1 Tax=Araneus ventricosus TaxID=182803 RepID=A0A4Y2J2P2_ARAVE|nr:hypothetical protein AVEN_28711-1 [Araneus ventricosus]